MTASIAPPSGSGPDLIRQHAISLFTFLKEVTELRTKTVRTVDDYDDVLWFADLPREQECDCAAWHRGREAESDNVEAWLEIRKPDLQPPPQPDPELELWLNRSQIDDSSLEMPDLREEIRVRIEVAQGEVQPEERFERRRIDEHPHIKELWERYVEEDWWPWKEGDRRLQPVQQVYTRLFSIYQKQQRLGEQYEVVLGLGLLAWKTPDGHEIRRHLITAQTALRFDSARGVITLGPAGEGAKLALEQDMLDPQFRPDPDELRALEAQLAEIGDEVWDPTQVDAALSSWVHSVSPKGVFREELERPGHACADPRVHLAPAVVLRKRTERSYLRMFEDILQKLGDGSPLPPGVERFVGVVEDPHRDGTPDPENTADTSTTELYFPLECNEAQKSIAERLANNQGVLVQGPPGTGKSHTIVNLICHLLATGQRVLVTSHTARALRVLRRFIKERAPEISPLAVVLLGDDRESLQAMENSVQGITDRHNHWDPRASAERITQLEKQLDKARREEASILSELRAIREKETYSHPPRFGGYEGTLEHIADRIHRKEGEYRWITDRPDENTEPPISGAEFAELLKLLRDERLSDVESLDWNAVDPSELPAPREFSRLVDAEDEAKRDYDATQSNRNTRFYAPLASGAAEPRNRLAGELRDLLAEVDRISRHIQTWTGGAVLQILADQDRPWRELFQNTGRHLAALRSRGRWADETAVSGLEGRDHSVVKADAKALLDHIEGGGHWGFGPFRPAPVKQGLYLRREVRIDGRLCESIEVLHDLISWLKVEEGLESLRRFWAPYAVVRSERFASRVAEYEDLCEPLEAALGLHKRKAAICTLIASIPGLSEPTWHDLDSLRSLRDTAEAARLQGFLEEASRKLQEVDEALMQRTGEGHVDPALAQLLASVRSRDKELYREHFETLESNYTLHEALARRRDLQSRLGCAAASLIWQR